MPLILITVIYKVKTTIAEPFIVNQRVKIQPNQLFTSFSTYEVPLLLMGFKLMAGAVASCALIGVAVGVGIIYGSLLISIGRNPSQRDELLRYAFIGFSLVEVSGLIGLVISLLLLFGFDGLYR